MPRRPPPSALRLIPGPTPPRSTPKHTLPSVPRPTFYHPATVSRGPSPRHRQTTSQPQNECLAAEYFSFTPSHERSGSLEISIPSLVSFASAATSPASSQSGSPKVRGPWDHSGSIAVPLDVENMLAPLKPVAISPGGR